MGSNASLSSGLSFAAACLACASPQSAALRSETVTVPGTSVKLEMVLVPGGRFRMGSPPGESGRREDEGPVLEAEVKPFWMGRYEITWQQYEQYSGEKDPERVDGETHPSPPYEPPDAGMGTGAHPAINIRWEAAKAFCAWCSKKTGKTFRLPTEAEWEFAARASSSGAAPGRLDDLAWHGGNSRTDSHPKGKTREVGTRKPNAFGLHDMLGNVWEWCLEPTGDKEPVPIARGGSWADPPGDLRFARRQQLKAEWYERDPNRPRSHWWLTDGIVVGFRVVREAEPGEK